MSVLEESDEPIAKLYCQILRFVERDLCRIMDIAEKVSIKSLPGGRLTPLLSTFPVEGDGKGFEIMANVVWDEFARAIMDELGSVVFSVGKPNVFRKVSRACDEPNKSVDVDTELRHNSNFHTIFGVSCAGPFRGEHADTSYF